MADRIPGIAAGWCSDMMGTVSICDNIGVMPYRLPDGETYVYTTDISDWLQFNPDDLTTQGWFEWNIEDFGKIVPTGTTHIVNDVGSSDTIGLMCGMDVGITGAKTKLHFYKVQADDLHKRIPIGTIETGKDMPYFHSFGHTEDYLIFARNSVNFNVSGMFEGKPMSENFEFDYDNMIDFYVMNKADGTHKKYTTDHGGMVMHSGNSYLDENNNLIYDAEMFIRSDTSPFAIFDLNWLRDPERSTVHVAMRMRRYTIDLDSGEVTYIDLLEKDKDVAGFIMINPNWQGKKHNYTYIISMDYSEESNTILQYNHEKGEYQSWSEEGVLMSEPTIVPNPNGSDELDALLMVSVFDNNLQANRLVMIDPKTM